jgi:hypothetical protein
MNRRMPNGTYGGVGGWGRNAPAYPILRVIVKIIFPILTILTIWISGAIKVIAINYSTNSIKLV